jgi:HK97 family phage major capsid protein
MNKMNVNNLRLERGQTVDQMQNLIDANQGDKWNNSIENQYQAMDTKQQNLKNQIGRAEKQGNLDSELDSIISRPTNTSLSNVANPAVSTQKYKDAFMNLMRVGKSNIGHDVVNALQVGTASEGGNITPTELDTKIVEYLQDFNELRQYVSVIQTSSDRDIPIETTLGAAAWVAEEAAYSESDAAFGKASLGAHKLTRIVKCSEELVNDSVFDLLDYLGRNFGKSFGLAEETAIVAGTGSGQPSGFVAAASTGVTAAAIAAVTASEVISLFHSLSRPYRKNAVFTMNDTTMAALRKLVDSTGQFIWQPGLQAGQPDLLLGRPVITTAAQAAMSTGVDAISFGDLSFYTLAERSGRVMQVLLEKYADTGQVGYRGYERLDGALIDTNAVKNLTMA